MWSLTAVCAQGPECIIEISGWGLGGERGQQGLKRRNALKSGVGIPSPQDGVGLADWYLIPRLALCVQLLGSPPY